MNPHVLQELLNVENMVWVGVTFMVHLYDMVQVLNQIAAVC